MMLRADRIVIEISEVEGDMVIAHIETPAGMIEMIASVSRAGGTLSLRGVHVQGATPGTLGRAGLNAVAQAILVEADVEELVIEGGTRTTGRRSGRLPRVIRVRRQVRVAAQGAD